MLGRETRRSILEKADALTSQQLFKLRDARRRAFKRCPLNSEPPQRRRVDPIHLDDRVVTRSALRAREAPLLRTLRCFVRRKDDRFVRAATPLPFLVRLPGLAFDEHAVQPVARTSDD